MWKLLRVSLLTIILIVVAGRFVLDRYYSRAWNNTLWIAVFPVSADDSAVTSHYISSLGAVQFSSIEAFCAREAQRHGLSLPRPVHVQLMPPVVDLPPRLERGADALSTALWSLRLRWYAWRNGDSISRVRVFVLYHDPALNPVVPHSLGLQKGLVGVVYGFADDGMTGQNAIVIAHEVLHTLGATDHYDLSSGQPIFPRGFAEPDREPRYPQPYAEIMAGRRALSPGSSVMPESLDGVQIGAFTALEINWQPQ